MLTIKSFGEFVGRLFDDGSKERERGLEALNSLKKELQEEKEYLEKLLNTGQAYQRTATTPQNHAANALYSHTMTTWSSTAPLGLTAVTTSSAIPVLPSRRMTTNQKTLYGHDGIGTSRLFLLAYDGTKAFFDEVIHPEVIDQVVGWLNDKVLMAYSVQRHLNHTRESQIAYMLREFGGELLMTLNPPKYWFIFHMDHEVSSTATLIGTITTRPFGAASGRGVDIGIMLGCPEGRGKGYGAEAMSAVINWHNARGATWFHIGTDERNDSMIKLAQTSGLKEYKREDGHVYMQMEVDPPPPILKRETTDNDVAVYGIGYTIARMP